MARIVAKIGGKSLETTSLRQAFAADVAALVRGGHRVIVVHGGGSQINELLQRLAIESHFVDGMRVTDAATLGVVEWVLRGEVGPALVRELGAHGLKAIGVAGYDGNFAVALRRVVALGYVAEELEVDGAWLQRLQEVALPVVASLVGERAAVGQTAGSAENRAVLQDTGGAGEEGAGVSSDGHGRSGGHVSGRHAGALNVNADVMASAIARATAADALVLLTDSPGVRGADDSVIASLDAGEVEALIARGTISGGMIPKVRFAAAAVRQGVRSVAIADGREPRALSTAIAALSHPTGSGPKFTGTLVTSRGTTS